jgi:ribosomal protein L37AE/L43A
LRYSEAYCRIPVAALHRGYDQGHGTLVWRDASGHTIGSAMVSSRFDGVMRVAFDMAASGAVEAYTGEVAISFVWRDAGMHRQEAYAVCPGCKRPAKHLIAKNHRWQCRRCHGLVNRSSLIRHNARLTEKVEHLEGEVGRGRRKGMHSRTYERLRAQLAEYRELLGEDGLSADARFNHVVTAHVSRKIEGKKIRLPSVKSAVGNQLFEGRLIQFLNEHFIANAERVVNALPADLRLAHRELLIDSIVQGAQLRTLVLGDVDELTAGLGASRQTVVEVSYLGDERLLAFHSEVGAKLPPTLAQIDQDAHVIRFVFSGDEESRPAVRARIDHELAALREQIARQTLSLATYHKYLRAEAARYIQSI